MDKGKINDVAAAFVKGQVRMTSAAMSVVALGNGKLVAQSYATPVAWRGEDGTVEVTTRKYSQSTSRHVNAVRDAALMNGNKIVDVDR